MKEISYNYDNLSDVKNNFINDFNRDWGYVCKITNQPISEETIIQILSKIEQADKFYVKKEDASKTPKMYRDDYLEKVLMRSKGKLSDAYFGKLDKSLTISLNEIRALILKVVISNWSNGLSKEGLAKTIVATISALAAFLCKNFRKTNSSIKRCIMLIMVSLTNNKGTPKISETDIINYRNERICPFILYEGRQCGMENSPNDPLSCPFNDKDFTDKIMNGLKELVHDKIIMCVAEKGKNMYYIPGLFVD